MSLFVLFADQAPWLADYDIKTQLQPVVQYLEFVGVEDVERVLRGYPQVCGLPLINSAPITLVRATVRATGRLLAAVVNSCST